MSEIGQRTSHCGNLFLILVVPHLLLISILPSLFFGYPQIAAPIIYIFAVIPILDLLAPRSRVTPEESQIGNIMARLLKMSPVLFVFSFSTLFFVQLATVPDLNPWTFALTTISFGAMGTVLIGAGHELIHKRPIFLRIVGEFVFVIFGYWHFTLAHIHNHHALVATEADNHAPDKDQSFWQYMWRAYPKAVSFTYHLLQKRRSKGQISTFHLACLLTIYFVSPLLIATAAYILSGPIGLAFYIAVSLLSLLFAEAVFYVQHYDVKRRGSERVAPHHSWDSDHRFSNYLTFMVQRHGDHHLKWGRHYYLLHAHQNSLYLPLGYPLMLLLALIPPLFFKVMNPRTTALNGTKGHLPQA